MKTKITGKKTPEDPSSSNFSRPPEGEETVSLSRENDAGQKATSVRCRSPYQNYINHDAKEQRITYQHVFRRQSEACRRISGSKGNVGIARERRPLR